MLELVERRRLLPAIESLLQYRRGLLRLWAAWRVEHWPLPVV